MARHDVRMGKLQCENSRAAAVKCHRAWSHRLVHMDFCHVASGVNVFQQANIVHGGMSEVRTSPLTWFTRANDGRLPAPMSQRSFTFLSQSSFFLLQLPGSRAKTNGLVTWTTFMSHLPTLLVLATFRPNGFKGSATHLLVLDQIPAEVLGPCRTRSELSEPGAYYCWVSVLYDFDLSCLTLASTTCSKGTTFSSAEVCGTSWTDLRASCWVCITQYSGC